MIDARRRRTVLTPALGFRAIEWRYRPDPAGALEKYLDSWRGLGDVVVGMHVQGSTSSSASSATTGGRTSTRPGWRIRLCMARVGSRRHGER